MGNNISNKPKIVHKTCRHCGKIKNPNSTKPKKYLESTCPICIEKPEKMAIFTNCGHVLCTTCLRVVTSCPLCREKINRTKIKVVKKLKIDSIPESTSQQTL